jgi:Uma2 family endonuclease
MFDPALLRPERVRPLLRREYEELINLGTFDDERVELLRGVLVEMSPQSEPHSRITAWLAQRLIKALDFDRYDVRSHSPFAASKDSMPEPDVSVAFRTTAGGYPRKALLLIEVAHSSLVKDRVIKREIYAEAGVPEYWIVDVRHDVVDVLTRPTKHGYERSQRLDAGAVLRPTRLPGVPIELDRIPWPTRAEKRPRRKPTRRSRRAK